jgi:Fe-S-cluster containining protein
MGMEHGSFECLRCAFCCRNLYETRGGVLRGLPLTEKETGLFPAELISPKLAIGTNGPETVVLYQLNVNCCPHLNTQNQCQIYNRRPLMCQSFPIVAGAISNRCKVFSYRKPGVNYTEPYTMAEQVQASQKLEKYTQKAVMRRHVKGLKVWEYDLAAKKWRHTDTL